jgi:hypothetical protein
MKKKINFEVQYCSKLTCLKLGRLKFSRSKFSWWIVCIGGHQVKQKCWQYVYDIYDTLCFNLILERTLSDWMPQSGHNIYIKGTAAWDFCPLVLFINRPHWGPCLLYYIIQILFQICGVIQIKICTAPWATAGNQIFFADTRI